MENDSSLNTTANQSTFILLPIGALAFAPFLLLELVAAIVSNAILLALVILACVKKLNNNINIYLFSLAIGGLIGAYNIFCTLTIVLARRWALGLVPCYLARFTLTTDSIFFIIIYVVISQEKLKTVKDPLHGRPTNKRAYIKSAIIWIASATFGSVVCLTWIRAVSSENDLQELMIEQGYFVCFGFPNMQLVNRYGFILASVYALGFFMITSIAIAITLKNFVQILLELHKLKKLRLRFANESRTRTVIRINQLDKPLNRTGEERTAKSLTFVYFIQVSSALISYLMFYVNTIRNYVLPPDDSSSPNFQIFFIVLLVIHLLQCINPIFLIMSNKRLRRRVEELFKCSLNPEVEESPVHRLSRSETARMFIAQKTNKITPLSY